MKERRIEVEIEFPGYNSGAKRKFSERMKCPIVYLEDKRNEKRRPWGFDDCDDNRDKNTFEMTLWKLTAIKYLRSFLGP